MWWSHFPQFLPGEFGILVENLALPLQEKKPISLHLSQRDKVSNHFLTWSQYLLRSTNTNFSFEQIIVLTSKNIAQHFFTVHKVKVARQLLPFDNITLLKYRMPTSAKKLPQLSFQTIITELIMFL